MGVSSEPGWGREGLHTGKALSQPFNYCARCLCGSSFSGCNKNYLTYDASLCARVRVDDVLPYSFCGSSCRNVLSESPTSCFLFQVYLK